jgi:hypothetical protein
MQRKPSSLSGVCIRPDIHLGLPAKSGRASPRLIFSIVCGKLGTPFRACMKDAGAVKHILCWVTGRPDVAQREHGVHVSTTGDLGKELIQDSSSGIELDL